MLKQFYVYTTMAANQALLRRIQLRRDTADKWTAINPVLAQGEIGYETTSPNRIKIGNGVTGWNSISYFNIGPTGRQGPTGNTGPTGPTGNTGNTGPPFMTIYNLSNNRIITGIGNRNDALQANSNLTFTDASGLSVTPSIYTSKFEGPGGSANTPLFTNSLDRRSGVFFPTTNVVGVSTFNNERLRIDNAGLQMTSGVIRNLNGSVSAPAYTFTSDLSVGLFRPASNKLGVVTAGVERMTIDATGQIGINKTTPLSLLDVNGTALISNLVVITDVSLNGLLKAPNATITSNINTSTVTATSDISSSTTLYGLNSVITSNIQASTVTLQNDLSSTGRVWANNASVVNTVSTAVLAASSDVSANGMVRAPLFVTSDMSVNSMIRLGGTLRSQIGSAIAPPYTFTADLSTGWFSPATNTVAWTTSGVERMRIQPDGNVGIGTQAPSVLFEVNGATKTSTLTATSDISSSTRLWGANATITSNISTSTLTASNVTIISNLLVTGDISGTNLTYIKGAYGEFSQTVTVGSTLSTTGNLIGNSDASIIGRLGIGKTVPNIGSGLKLDVDGSANIQTNLMVGGTAVITGATTISNTANVTSNLTVGGSANISGNLLVGNISNGASFSNISLFTNGDQRMIISSNGLQMISGVIFNKNGTASIPGYTFGDDPFVGMYLPSASNLAFSTVGTERMRIDGSGQVMINRTSASYPLDVSGTARAGDFIATSDRRVKTDIETISNALDIVNGLRGVYFTRIGETQRQVGVIAQEVEEFLPEVVHTSLDDLKSVSYGNMVGVLIEAIKDVSKRLEKMENKE